MVSKNRFARKLEKRYKRGKVQPKDVEKWGRGNSAKGVIQRIVDLWKAENIGEPKIIGTSDAIPMIPKYIEGLGGGCQIRISTRELKESKKLLERLKWEISGTDLLSMILGRDFSFCILSQLEPENLNYGFDFGKLEQYSKEDFNYSVSIGSQSKAIGELGYRAIGRELGTFDPEMNRKAIKLSFREIEKTNTDAVRGQLKRIDKILTKRKRKAVYRLRLSQKDVEERIKEKRAMDLNAYLSLVIIGNAITFVADDLEKHYDGKLHELIKKRFEPDKKYVESFERFVRAYVPVFGLVLENEFSLIGETIRRI